MDLQKQLLILLTKMVANGADQLSFHFVLFPHVLSITRRNITRNHPSPWQKCLSLNALGPWTSSQHGGRKSTNVLITVPSAKKLEQFAMEINNGCSPIQQMSTQPRLADLPLILANQQSWGQGHAQKFRPPTSRGQSQTPPPKVNEAIMFLVKDESSQGHWVHHNV